MFRAEGPYADFLEKREAFLEAQSEQQAALANKVRREVEWLRRGPKARTGKSKARIDAAHELMGELAEVSARNAKATTRIDFTASGRKTRKLIRTEAIAKLGKYSNPKQQPVDFAIWQAADGSWQIWSCIRGTNCGGKTRLFYRWQGSAITDRERQPMGIAMEADPAFGETAGGLQAPHVLKIGAGYYMFYGDSLVSKTEVTLSECTH